MESCSGHALFTVIGTVLRLPIKGPHAKSFIAVTGPKDGWTLNRPCVVHGDRNGVETAHQGTPCEVIYRRHRPEGRVDLEPAFAVHAVTTLLGVDRGVQCAEFAHAKHVDLR